MAGVGTLPKLLAGMRATSTITGRPPPGHTATRPRVRDLEVAPRRRRAAAQADAGRRHVEALAGLVLAQDTGDVVVDHHHLVGMAVPLAREDADGGRAAADAHAPLLDAV